MIKSKKRKKTRQGDGIVNLGISEERRDVSLAGGGGGGACGLVGGGGGAASRCFMLESSVAFGAQVCGHQTKDCRGNCLQI